MKQLGGARLRILYLSPFAPDRRADHAGGQFFHQYLAALGDQVTCTVVVPDRPDNDIPAERLPPGVAVHRLSVDDLSVAIHRRRMAVRAAFTGFPMEPGFLRSLRRSSLVADALARADAVELHWDQLLPLLPWLRRRGFRRPVGVFAHDLLCQSAARRAETSSGIERTVVRYTATVARRREPALLRRASPVLTFSDSDAETLRGWGVRSPIVVDPSFECPTEPWTPALDPTALFVGAFWRRENARSAAWLLDEVWPRVIGRLPAARLVIAGAQPPTDLVERGGNGIEITGLVEDLQVVYRRARCVVAPLVSGAGVKFKVVQAMAYGLPVVATAIGAEGIVSRTGPGAFAAITDHPQTFADACVEILSPGDLATTTGAAAATAVRGAFSLQRSLPPVLARYREAR